MQRYAVESGVRHTEATDPFVEPHPWYVLLELSGSTAVQNALPDALRSHLESGAIADAIVAESLTQAATLWRLRESTWQGQVGECVTIRHDVAVPISAIPTFIDRATEACATIAPNAPPTSSATSATATSTSTSPTPTLSLTPTINRAIHDIVANLNGSISAEHGIGRLKRDQMARYKSHGIAHDARGEECFDPEGLLNPDHVLP